MHDGTPAATLPAPSRPLVQCVSQCEMQVGTIKSPSEVDVLADGVTAPGLGPNGTRGLRRLALSSDGRY